MAVDRITLEVLRNYYQAIVEDMARIVERTAYTSFVKETADFSTGLVANSGEYVAYPWRLGASIFLGMNMIETLRFIDEYDEGDIVICNDPYLSGPLCTHLPDLHLLKPLFHEGRIVCWAYTFVHSSDIGGAVPASVWPKAREIFQEGLRLRPAKLYRAGELNRDLLNVIMDNSRIPELNWGDIKAMVAAVNSCERRVHEMIAKFGIETFSEGIDAVLDYAEQRARAVISDIPDGTYEFTDYMEDDLQSDVPVRLKVAMTVAGDEIHLDFTGTDPQVASALNLATNGVSHPFICQAIIAFMLGEDPDLPKASSILRPVRVTTPPGSVVNSQFPAACGVRAGTGRRTLDLVLGALAQAVDRIPAAPSGTTTIVVASVPEPFTGKRRVQVVEPMQGGGGGRYNMDGTDAVDSTSGFLRNTPIETTEIEIPIVVRRYHMLPNTGGPGEHRGGLAVRLDFQVYHPDTIVTARGMERFKLQPFGVDGGRAGTAGSCVVNRDTDHPRDIGKVDLLRLEPGDVVSMFTPAGGGRGDPRKRDPERVLADLRAGWVTEDWAREQYGVVFRDGAVDEEATARLRAGMPEPAGMFEFGDARVELEQRWPPELQDAAFELLQGVPVAVRDWGKHQIYDAIQRVASERRPTVADARAAWDEIRARLSRALVRQASEGEGTSDGRR